MHAISRMNLGEGERAQRAQSRRHLIVKGILFVIGAGCGAYLGYSVASNDFDVAAPWPPAIAITMAVVYVVALIGGSFALEKSIDELERHRTYKAVAVAGTAYMLVYPVWFLLWKASVAVEPIHWLLFVGFWLLLIGSALFYRFR